MILITRLIDGATISVAPNEADVRARVALASVDERGRHVVGRVMITHDDGLKYTYQLEGQ